MDKLLTTTATTTTDTSNKVQKSHNNNNNNNNLYTQTDLQAQNSHIPSSLTHFTHTQNNRSLQPQKFTDSNQPHKHRFASLKIQQIPTTLTNTDPYCNFKNSDIPSSKNTTHIIPNLKNFTDSKLSNKHTHTHTHTHTQTHTNLLLQAQISQISGFFL